jgi:hypothetical protein
MIHAREIAHKARNGKTSKESLAAVDQFRGRRCLEEDWSM